MMPVVTAGAGSKDLELGATDWPEGCLGYAFNLLRPTQPGHRRQLMFSAFGTQLVSSLGRHIVLAWLKHTALYTRYLPFF